MIFGGVHIGGTLRFASGPVDPPWGSGPSIRLNGVRVHIAPEAIDECRCGAAIRGRPRSHDAHRFIGGGCNSRGSSFIKGHPSIWGRPFDMGHRRSKRQGAGGAIDRGRHRRGRMGRHVMGAQHRHPPMPLSTRVNSRWCPRPQCTHPPTHPPHHPCHPMPPTHAPTIHM